MLKQNCEEVELNGDVIMRGGAKGRASKQVEAIDKDKRAGEVFPAFGDWILHPVQAHVQFVDDVAVTVTDLSGPRQQEVVGWFPHGLKWRSDKWRLCHLIEFTNMNCTLLY